MIKRKLRRPVAFYTGMGLLLLLSLVALIGPWVIPYSPHQMFLLPVRAGEIIGPPELPSERHWMGTDAFGRDMLTLVLLGLRYTLLTVLLVAGLRILFGGMIGVLKGLSPQAGKRRLEGTLMRVTRLFPAFFIAFFLLFGINQMGSVEVLTIALVQLAVLVLIGIPQVVHIFEAYVTEWKGQSFVEASKLMGGSKWWIARKHLWPWLKDAGALFMFQECILVLNLLGQLGVLGVFVGGMTRIENVFEREQAITRSFEWAGLLTQNKSFVISYPEIILIPVGLFLLLLFSLYLVSRGLERGYQREREEYPYV
jgi:peptide/nickel transport system permease protein